MGLEALSSNDFLNFIINDATVSGGIITPHTSSSTDTNLLFDENDFKAQEFGNVRLSSVKQRCRPFLEPPPAGRRWRQNNLSAVQAKKANKRRRKPRVCKNKEEAEMHRMTHIAVERNRRKQMNEHLAVLRSLMPECFVQRGDQASIVGGAIEFVKDLEHQVQSLETQKHLIMRQELGRTLNPTTSAAAADVATTTGGSSRRLFSLQEHPFSQFVSSRRNSSVKMSSSSNSYHYKSSSKPNLADIEVTLIETHANIRILSQRSVNRQLAKMVSGFHTLSLSILHLYLTTLDSLVLYSISAKAEEGCQFSSAEDIADAVQHMLRIIIEEEETILFC